MSKEKIMGGWDKAIEKIIDMEKVGRKTNKLTPIQKLEKIIDDLYDKGKPFRKLSLYEIRLLQELYYFEHLITFDTTVANVARELGFNVELDEKGINYEISV